MRIYVVVDRKDNARWQSDMEGAALFFLKKWIEQAGVNLGIDLVRVKRLGDKAFDTAIPQPRASGIAQDLIDFKPDIVIGLGKMALQFLKGKDDVSLDSERGMPFKNVINGQTTICTFTPRYTFMVSHDEHIAKLDFQKAIRLGKNGWTEPEYNNYFHPTFEEAKERLQWCIDNKDNIHRLSIDIETLFTSGKMTCFGFAWSETDAMVIPFVSYSWGGQYRKFTWEQTLILMRLIKKMCEVCKCVGQNAVHFDHYVLARNYGILANLVDDTMFGWWELYPSFDKNLGFMSSILTDNAYWKGMLKEARNGKVERWQEFKYNGLDCIVALQCANRIEAALAKKHNARQHYDFNIRVSRAYQHMAFQGCMIDKDLLEQKKKETEQELKEKTEQFYELAGKKISVTSPKQMKDWLYIDLGLPMMLKVKKDKYGNREATETADALSVYILAGKHPEIPALRMANQLRKLHKRLSGLEGIQTDDKGCCRWSFNCVGTKVGRSSGYKPLHEPGVQPQNVDKLFRDLFIPPRGYLWVKADLEGADSVTMAACMKAIEEQRMLGEKQFIKEGRQEIPIKYEGLSNLYHDIDAWIKPAQVVALEILLKQPVTTWSIEKIKEHLHLLKTKEGKKIYKIAKAINHGSAYMLGFSGMSDNMLRLSEGELYVSPDTCKHFQQTLYARYDYRMYHGVIKGIMEACPMLKAGNGQERYFYGRPDSAMHREMCSYLPQVHTAFVTNKVIERFYYDKNSVLKLCNQVHDELCGFVLEDDVDKLEEQFRQKCNVPLTIWNVPFVIRFEAQVGPTWGTLTRDLNLYS